MKRFSITQEGFERLKDDLRNLKEVERPKIVKELDFARGLGDLSENAEYHAAKDALAILTARINELEHKVSTARIVEEHQIDGETALLGAKVRLRDLNRDREVSYTLVSDVASDFKHRRISVTSPVGKGLLGAKVGQVVEIDVPAGTLKYEVIEISR